VAPRFLFASPVHQNFEEMLLVPVHPLALHIGKMLAGIVRLMTSGSVIWWLFTGKLWSFLNPLFLLLLVLNVLFPGWE